MSPPSDRFPSDLAELDLLEIAGVIGILGLIVLLLWFLTRGGKGMDE
jgi:hypothetical protein